MEVGSISISSVMIQIYNMLGVLHSAANVVLTATMIKAAYISLGELEEKLALYFHP